MPPNATPTVECTGVLNETDAETIDGGLDKNIVELKHAGNRDIVFVWRNIIAFAYVHVAAVYGVWLIFSSAKLYTTAFGKTNHLINFYCFFFFFFDALNHRTHIAM